MLSITTSPTSTPSSTPSNPTDARMRGAWCIQIMYYRALHSVVDASQVDGGPSCAPTAAPQPSVSTLAMNRISPDCVSRTANRKGRSTTTGTGGIGIDLVIITAAVTAAASVPSSFTMIRACVVSVRAS